MRRHEAAQRWRRSLSIRGEVSNGRAHAWRHATSSASREGPNRASATTVTRMIWVAITRGRGGEVLKPHRVAENHAADDHAQALAQGGLQDLLLSYHCGAREQWVSLDRVGERVRVAHRGTPE